MNANRSRRSIGRRTLEHGTLVSLMLGLALGAACQSQRQAVTTREDQLAAAGFVVRPANTPERQAMLKRLPPNHFVQRTHGDTVHYVYADPLVCKDYSRIDSFNGKIARTDAAHDRFNSDNFSRYPGGDIDNIILQSLRYPGFRGYLGTPSGVFKLFDPAAGTTTVLR